MNPSVIQIIRLIIALIFASPVASAETSLRLPAVFGDHMVLQRDREVPIWGWSQPGGEVSVEFANQKKTGKADAEGKWMVKLDPLVASMEPGRMEISQAAETVALSNVLIGDVWLCSGQSNMHFKMNRTENSQKEIAAADHSALRFFNVQSQFSQQPESNAKGSWQQVSPATAADCSAVAYYFARDLQQKIGVPIGLLVSSVGGTRIETWMQPETLAKVGITGPLIDKWKQVPSEEFERIASAYLEYQRQRDQVYPLEVKTAKAQGSPAPPEPTMPKMRAHDCPGALHNSMIAPLLPLAIRGAIWYQGESNAGQSANYEKLLPAMIADWRHAWGDQLPFLFVQLAPHKSVHPTFREAQLRIWQKTPHAAMIVTTDVGDANDIHPTRKRPVGERLALAARALSYGEPIEYSGPVYKSMSIESDKAVVSFTHASAGLVAKGGELKGFSLAGADGKFLPAQAEIDGSSVVVTSEQISKPVAVRYGWATVPEVNLFNREGLPATPFRSDSPTNSNPPAESGE